MKVIVNRDLVTARVSIWITDDRHQYLHRYSEMGTELVPIIEGVEPPAPSITMHEDMWNALVEHVRSEPHGLPTRDAIDDARKIRDRLLTMIEQRWAG